MQHLVSLVVLTNASWDPRHGRPDHATIAIAAGPRYGAGNGSGGVLNLLDLMVYAVAKERGEALLCTGQDFATTDLQLHAAIRPF